MSLDATRSFALALSLAALAAASGAGAETPPPKPFASGKAATGEALVKRDCIECHAKRFGGDADRIYRRPEHKVRTPAQLLAQVQTCNVQLGAGYFPEEEEHVAAYLNLHYYKFAP